MHYKLILASGSPRRRELLSGLNMEFETRLLPDIDESYPEGLSGEEIAKTIARRKAEAYRASMAYDELIITADTIVYIDNRVLGKPKDAAEAISMLKTLRGRTHQVITGVTLMTQDKEETFAVVTDVTFNEITDNEIEYYVSEYEPFDKAGAYGIQEWIGLVAVERIEGSYFNVMGLPIARLYQTLKYFL